MAPPAIRLFELASTYLDRQAWYAVVAGEQQVVPLSLVSCDVLRDEHPGLARLIVANKDRHFQLLVGWRDATEVSDALRGHDGAVLGASEDGEDRVLVYDTLADDELCCLLLQIVTNNSERAQRIRRVSTLVSHAAIVYDERLFMKCYRVLEKGVRPEVEVLFRLDEAGFNALLAPVASWHDRQFDLALVREFLPSALEGRLLALTSLRDLLAHVSDASSAPGSRVLLAVGSSEPTEDDLDRACAAAGGDIASEIQRLGVMTARLHIALAGCFGEYDVDVDSIVTQLRGHVEIEERDLRPEQVSAVRLVERLGQLDVQASGKAIRLHGDYHLRRVMRGESGWLVTGFSDDPLYASYAPDASLPARVGSPLEDVADMSFAITRVADEALAQRGPSGSNLGVLLAKAWARRARRAFFRGYVTTEGIDRLLPESEDVQRVLVRSHELIRSHRYDATSASV